MEVLEGGWELVWGPRLSPDFILSISLLSRLIVASPECRLQT